jgi:nitrogen fixation/metabolism regulation signal transduction histidine kinase
MDANSSLDTADETLNVTAEVTGRAVATREGVLTAYVSLIIMAVFPILVGAIRSVDYHRAAREKAKQSGEAADRLTTKDAAMFPLIASGALLGLYIFFMVSLKTQFIDIKPWFSTDSDYDPNAKPYSCTSSLASKCKCCTL